MSRIALAVCLAALIVSAADAEPAASDVVLLVPKLETGARFSFMHRRVSEKETESGTSTSEISEVPITLEVIGRAGGGWLLERREGLAVVSGEDLEPPMDVVMKGMVASRNGAGLRFELDADGSFKRLVKVEGYAKELRERSAASPPAAEPDVAAFAEMMSEMVTDPRFIEEHDGSALEALFACSGLELSPGKPRSVETSTGAEPGVVGSKVVLTAEMIASDEKTVTATLSVASAGKGDAAAASKEGDKIAPGLGALASALADVDQAYGMEARCVIARDTLMPSDVQHAVRTTLGAMTKIQRHEFKSIPATPDPAPPRAAGTKGK